MSDWINSLHSLSNIKLNLNIIVPTLSTLSNSINPASDVVVNNIILFSCNMITQVAALFCKKGGRVIWHQCIADAVIKHIPENIILFKINTETWALNIYLLEEGIEWARLNQRGYKVKGGSEGGTYLPPPIPNGRINSSVQLVCAL